ncbi:hypothetical protein RKE29_25210 [Streptomyces sp. B1866]|uniref:hypothetical protein n=1 Tax=Streptomyces sp. B1866 TaxID=3075431 RepID=UPI002891F9EF|nr:hypothetical protein [Streptomyces sp. B1866]MDT3399892.1 hypothetical protein [Streptomyces sp. B1866]
MFERSSREQVHHVPAKPVRQRVRTAYAAGRSAGEHRPRYGPDAVVVLVRQAPQLGQDPLCQVRVRPVG